MHGADRYEAARGFHMLVENLERKARGLEGGARTVDQKGSQIFAPEDPCGMLKPMTTTMTSGDILINILIVFGCAFVLWLLQKCTSVIADYLSSRSMSSRLKQISSLESRLANYESDFSDSRIFIGRITTRAILTIVWFSSCTLCLGLAFLLKVAHQLLCEFRNDCIYSFFWPSDFSELLHPSLIFLMLAAVSLGAYFSHMGTLRLETSPEKFRARMNDRIARLRDGISEN